MASATQPHDLRVADDRNLDDFGQADFDAMISFGASQLRLKPNRSSAHTRSPPCKGSLRQKSARRRSTQNISPTDHLNAHSHHLPKARLPDPSNAQAQWTTGLCPAGRWTMVGLSVVGFIVIIIGCMGFLWRRDFFNDAEPASRLIATAFPELPFAARIVHSKTYFDSAMRLLKEHTRLTQNDSSLSIADFSRLLKLTDEVTVSAEHTYYLFPPTISLFCSDDPSTKGMQNISWVLQHFMRRSASIVHQHNAPISQALSIQTTLHNEAARNKQDLIACEETRIRRKGHESKACEVLANQQSLIMKIKEHLNNALSVLYASLGFWEKVEVSASRMQKCGTKLEGLVSNNKGVESKREILHDIKEELWKGIELDVP